MSSSQGHRADFSQIGLRSAEHVRILCEGVSELLIAQTNTETAVVRHLDEIAAGINEGKSLRFGPVDQCLERRKTVSRWLSEVPYADHHAAITSVRLSGTGTWFLERPEYQDWRDKIGSEILWLHGDREFIPCATMNFEG